MVVRVTGKNASRVQQIFRAALLFITVIVTVDGFASKEDEVAGLLALFPDDVPLVFQSAEVPQSLESAVARSALWWNISSRKLARHATESAARHRDFERAAVTSAGLKTRADHHPEKARDPRLRLLEAKPSHQ